MSDTPPLSDIPGGGHDRAPEVRGARVLVHYEVSCSLCDIEFTDARGVRKDVGRSVRVWRQREQIAVVHRTATVTVRPKGEEDRVRSVPILVDGSRAVDAPIPAGGSMEPVVLSANLLAGSDAPDTPVAPKKR